MAEDLCEEEGAWDEVSRHRIRVMAHEVVDEVDSVEGAECVVPWIGRPRGLIETALKNTVRIIIMTTVEV